MTLYRLNRLFNPTSGRALDVAVDHGFFGERSFITGIENMDKVVRTLVEAGPDAVQLTLGQARRLQSYPGKQKPGLVLRTDIANVYNNPLDSVVYSHHVPHAVEEAVRLDAVALCVNLMDLPGHPEVREANIRSIMALRKEATRYGMPLMVEPLVMQDNEKAGGGYMVNGDIDKIVTLVRQGVELGADLIKSDPSDDISEYGRVIEVAGDIPVLVRGGGRVDDRTLLERTVAVLDAGAKGIVYGRNVVQHENPAGITAALMAVLHDGADVDQALTILAESDAARAEVSA
ncbi:MAG: aldolase [Herbiconiux sp.]|uniref:class I fructose-bisphosphate aldolase n=1 Tax=Herbiconiux sp. TaxID=1871186 RepID=UPI00120B9FEA|nr:aldolase [Herbiconiux sp.]TAJ47053.1 MAG: aldolase [Herbiconiux sp.]